MSASIQSQSILVHLDSGLNAASAYQYTAFENAFTSSAISVSTVDETPSLGDIVTPRTYELKLVSGDALRIGLDGSTYPFRLAEAGESMLLRLDVEGRRETTTVTTGADTAGSLANKYFQFYDRNGTVRPWFAIPAQPEISTVATVADVADSLDGKYFLIYDDIGSVEVWINTSGGSATAPGVGARAIAVPVTTGDTADAVATAIQTAVDADSKFSATVSTNNVTITDASNGTRTNIAAGTSGFTVAVSQQGLAAPSSPGGGTRMVQVDITYGATASAVATAIETAFASDTEVDASAVGSTVTITDKHTGTRTASGAGNTGWSAPTSDGAGAASPVIHLKSTGTSQVLVAIAPN